MSKAKSKPTEPETDNPGGYTPFRIDTTGTPLTEDHEPLFYVDDREYTAPREVPARLAVRALRVAATQGEDAARWFLVENALTPEAIHELTEGEASEYVTREQVRSLFAELGRRYFGQAQDLAGK